MTALRWARLLRELGHTVQVIDEYLDHKCDVLVALHARKSFPSIKRFHCTHSDLPLIVALSGTDLYQDLTVSLEAQQSVEWATRIVSLQPLASKELRLELQAKVRSIIQSAIAPRTSLSPLRNRFEVCVSGHLRPVKDPFRAAESSRLLPTESRIQITQIGAAMSPEMGVRARKEMAENPRYKWKGEREPWEARKLMARSRLVLVTSLLEGGANVVSEAIAAGVPLVHSRIPGAVGILGEDYPGFFEVGDTAGLARILRHAETDLSFYAILKEWCLGLQALVTPERERESWRALLGELGKF